MKLKVTGGFKLRGTLPALAGMVPSAMPENAGVGPPPNLSRRRTTDRWVLLLAVGICSGALGALLQGFLTLWFFGRHASPFTPTYNAFEWGQAYAGILFGVGIILVGLGWTLDERARQIAQYPAAESPGRTAVAAGSILAILGAAIAAGGELLFVAILISDLEGVGPLANALGPGWSTGLPDLMLGVGLLIAGTGVVGLWFARRRAGRFA